MSETAHLALVASRYYGRAGGITTYIDEWLRALRDAPTQIHLLRSQIGARALRRALDETHERVPLGGVIVEAPEVAVGELVVAWAERRSLPTMAFVHSVGRGLSRREIDAYAKMTCRATVSHYMAGLLRPDAFVLDPLLDLGFWSAGAVEPSLRAQLRASFRIGERPLIFAPHLIYPRKGQWHAVAALRQLRERGVEAVLVLAGAVPSRRYAAQLRAAIDAWNLHNQVVWLPALDRPSVRAWYAACDVVVMPTLREPLGLVALEAQAMGKPVVGFATGGLVETVRGGGLLVAPRATEALASALADLLRDADKRRAMGARGASFVRSQYSPQLGLLRHRQALATFSAARAPQRRAWLVRGPVIAAPHDLGDGLCEPCAPTVDALLARIDAQRAIVDESLTAPARWRGSLRRELGWSEQPELRARTAAAFDWARDAALGEVELDLAALQHIHHLVTGVGELRRGRLRVARGHFTYPSPAEARALVNRALHNARDVRLPAALRAIELFVSVVAAHPFRDGNGRSARIAAGFVLMRAGFRSTLFTVMEQHFDHAPETYVPIFNRWFHDFTDRQACLVGFLRAMMVRSRLVAWWRERARRMRAVCRSESELISFDSGQDVPCLLQAGERPWRVIRGELAPAVARELAVQLGRLRDEERADADGQ